MKKPNPKDYSSKDHLRGKYSDDLEKYIDYLEGKSNGKKQLTKEQHEAIFQWLIPRLPNPNDFKVAFPPDCCDSCADGEECDKRSKISESDIAMRYGIPSEMLTESSRVTFNP